MAYSFQKFEYPLSTNHVIVHNGKIPFAIINSYTGCRGNEVSLTYQIPTACFWRISVKNIYPSNPGPSSLQQKNEPVYVISNNVVFCNV